jgi:hypothetical protein
MINKNNKKNNSIEYLHKLVHMYMGKMKKMILNHKFIILNQEIKKYPYKSK